MLNKINISPQKHIVIFYIFLVLVLLAVFWQVNQFDFINVDDDIYVTDNGPVQSGITLEGVRWAFRTTHAQFWHPLTWLSLMLDYHLFGLSAGGYHVTNLILHILSTLLLFWLFNRMTGAVWKSAFVAAFFALHPLRVESVAWISERKDVLSVFFWMLTLCLYVYYTGKPAVKRYLFVLFSFVLALMSKPMVVTLPVVMLLLDYWPLGRFQSQKGNWILWQLKEKTIFFILSVIISIITLNVQYNPAIKHFSLDYRLANIPFVFMTYLEKIFWPHNLAILYPLTEQLPIWQILISAIFIIFLSIALILMVKRHPYLFVGWFWYAITLLPVIGITQIGTHSIHDLYTYLPSVGIAVMLAWGIPLLFLTQDKIQKILLPAGICVLVILSILSWRQCAYWINSISILNRDLKVTDGSIALVHNNIAVALAEEGKPDEAIYHYNEAIRLKPTYADAYNNRGTFYGEQKQYQLAIENFNKAIALKPESAKTFYNRGTAYFYVGQYQHAINDYNEAIRIKPDYADAYNNRVVACLKQGNMKLGCYEAQKACARGYCETLETAKAGGYCR